MDSKKRRDTILRLTFWLALKLACITSTHAAELISSFSTPAGDWHLGTIAVGNIDGGTDLEIVVPYRSSQGWFLDAFKATGTRVGGFPYKQPGYKEINVSPTLFDLNGDGMEEIFFTCGSQVVALRGNGTVLWATEINRSNYIPNGGYQTITNGFYWSTTGEWIPQLPETAVFSSQFMPPIIADVNGDGRLDVATAWKIDPDSTCSAQDFNPFINDVFGFAEWGTVGEDWSGGVVLLNAADGAPAFVYHMHQLVESGLALGQADGDAAREVYVLNDSDSVVAFDYSQPHGFHGSGMLHGMFGKNQRVLSGSYQQSIDLNTADIDGDGLSEVLVPMTQRTPLWQPSDTIMDDDGSILWRGWKEALTFDHSHGWLNNGTMIPVNPDRDNHIDVLTFTHSDEISFRSWNGVELVDRPGWPKTFAPYLPSPPVVGDVDGDGAEEILIATYHPTANPSDGHLYIFGLDGSQEALMAVPGGVKQIPALADVNGDGSLDVVVRSLNGQISISNFGAKPGAAVSWSSHRGSMRRDGQWSRDLYPAGTPRVIRKVSGYGRTRLFWTNGITASAYEVFRAEDPAGPFTRIADLPATASSFMDSGLQLGQQYIYEVGAVVGTAVVRSAPVPVLSCLNSNLLQNSGFEENDNSHWDKWFMGNLGWSNITADALDVHGGRRSMAVKLTGHASQSSIKQANQYGLPDSSIHVIPGTLYSFGGFFKNCGTDVATQHWLEWNPTITAQYQNIPGPYPYPDYFTPLYNPGTSPAEWVYANRTFYMPAGFNVIELRHRFETVGLATGKVNLDDLFFRALPPVSDPRWTDLLPMRSTWRYRAGVPVEQWYLPLVSESGWLVGRAKFGCGAATEVVTRLLQNQRAYVFRTHFVVTNTALEELLLTANIADEHGAVETPLELYLNGQKLITSGIHAVSARGSTVKYFDLTPFIDRLRPGTNTIAVQVNNAFTDWDDMAFDMGIKAIASGEKPPARIMGLQFLQNGVRVQISAPEGTSWRLECTEDVGPAAAWHEVERFTVPAGERLTITDPRLNRPTATGPGSRFYRVRPVQ